MACRSQTLPSKHFSFHTELDALRSRFKTCSNVDVFLSRRTDDDKIWTHTLSNQVIWVSWSVSRTCSVPQIYSLRWRLLQGQCTYLALTHWHTPTPHILLPLSSFFAFFSLLSLSFLCLVSLSSAIVYHKSVLSCNSVLFFFILIVVSLTFLSSTFSSS